MNTTMQSISINKNETSILDDLFEDVSLYSKSFDYPSSSFFQYDVAQHDYMQDINFD